MGHYLDQRAHESGHSDFGLVKTTTGRCALTVHITFMINKVVIDVVVLLVYGYGCVIQTLMCGYGCVIQTLMCVHFISMLVTCVLIVQIYALLTHVGDV